MEDSDSRSNGLGCGGGGQHESRTFVYSSQGEEAPRDVAHVTLDENVRIIGSRAFQDRKNLREVVPNVGLRAIGMGAFRGCSSLERIALPPSVREVYNNAFWECLRLEEIVLNEGIEMIGFWAFRNCTSLEFMRVPSSVREINPVAFFGCDKLRHIHLSEGLKSIGGFQCCPSLERVEIPSSAEVVLADAFSGCKKLKLVTFLGGLRSIGEGAFRGCESLECIEVPPSVKEIGDSSFHNCARMRSVRLSEGLESIARNAFCNCSSLEIVKIPSTVNKIGMRAFNSCQNLRVLHLSDGITAIGDWACSACVSLECVGIPPSVSAIGAGAFSRCTGMKTLALSSGLKTIGRSAFGDCSSLLRVEIPPSVENFSVAFSGCCSLKEVVLNQGIRVVGPWAFSNCHSLETVRIPWTIKEIGDYAFTKCYRLKVVDLNEGISKIGRQSFRGCGSLLRINIPASITSIDANAFHDCHNLRNITISSHSRKGVIESSLASIHGENWCPFDDLKARFEGFPVHELCYLPLDKFCYHQPYSKMLADSALRSFTNKVVEHAATGNDRQAHQDCLGMTPIHVLACSTNHDLSLYQFLVERNPEYLITKDKWGQTPLFYATVSEVPTEILQLFFSKYNDLSGEFPLDLGNIIKDFALRQGASLEFLQSMIQTQMNFYPDPNVHWASIVDELFQLQVPVRMLRYLTKVSLSKCLEWLSPHQRREVEKKIEGIPDDPDRSWAVGHPRRHLAAKRERLDQIRGLATYFELRDALTLIELALWKLKISSEQGHSMHACRVNCGAESVIKGVLQFFTYNCN